MGYVGLDSIDRSVPFEPNLGASRRVLRLLAATAFAAVYLLVPLPATVAVAGGVLGFYAAFSGLVGYCPLVRWVSRARDANHPAR